VKLEGAERREVGSLGEFVRHQRAALFQFCSLVILV